jgi:hypothetical protein
VCLYPHIWVDFDWYCGFDSLNAYKKMQTDTNNYGDNRTDFKYLHVIEFAAEINADGNGIRYIPPSQHPTNIPEFNLGLGEDKFIERAIEGTEPEASVRQREWAACLKSIPSVIPNSPESLQDIIASAVSLIKVEAQFNPKKVGTTVHVVAIDKYRRRTYNVTL